MTVQHDPAWLVEGKRGAHWFVARSGDEACEKYRARFGLQMYELDEMCVVDVRRDVRDEPPAVDVSGETTS